MKQYTPSELANLTGVTPRTIRYYDQRGLLKPETRSEEGYRLYGSDALLRMQRITMLKFAGFSLGEIRDALEVTEQENLWQLLRDQKQLITQRIEQLEEMDALYQDFSETTCLDSRIAKKKAQREKLEQKLNSCFPEIECHVFQNDLPFTVVEELYRYLMDSYRELVQELESSGTDFIDYLRKVMGQKRKIVLHSQVRMYRCKKEEA